MNQFTVPYERVTEIDALLADDETLLGRVYRYDLEGNGRSRGQRHCRLRLHISTDDQGLAHGGDPD